jgi:hypothetical protein
MAAMASLPTHAAPTVSALARYQRLLQSDPVSRHVLSGLLALTAVVILVPLIADIHALRTGTEFALHKRFRVNVDRGLPELVGYVHLWLASTFLVVAAILRRSVWLAFFALVFFTAMVDDAMRLHERGGRLLVSAFEIEGRWGLRGQDFGEMIVFAALIGSLLVPLALALRSASPWSEGETGVLFLLSGLLAFFAVGIDMLHFLAQSEAGNYVQLYLEDGGELVVMALVASFAFTLVRSIVLEHLDLRR